MITLELWPTPERVDILNRFLGFFSLIRQAVIDSALLSYAKVYDHDSRTASIPVLLTAAKTNPNILAPHSKDGDLAALEALVRKNDRTLGNLRRLRNQRLAHTDAYPTGDMSLPKGKLDQLVEDTEQAFNELSRIHDRLGTLFDAQVNRTERDTSQIVEGLQKAEDVRRRRGTALIQVADLISEAESQPAITASDQVVLRKVMQSLLEDEEYAWILLRDDLPSLSQESSNEEAGRVFAELRVLVDSALGL